MSTPLHTLEVRLAQGLRLDATEAELPESAARLLLAIDPTRDLSMSQLAHRIGRDTSTVTRFTDRAIKLDLVERQPGAIDARKRILRLTEFGLTKRNALHQAAATRLEHLVHEVRTQTGLGENNVNWFLQALTNSLSAPKKPGISGA